MTAPETNVDKQARRHRWPLIAFAVGIVVAARVRASTSPVPMTSPRMTRPASPRSTPMTARTGCRAEAGLPIVALVVGDLVEQIVGHGERVALGQGGKGGGHGRPARRYRACSFADSRRAAASGDERRRKHRVKPDQVSAPDGIWAAAWSGGFSLKVAQGAAACRYSLPADQNRPQFGPRILRISIASMWPFIGGGMRVVSSSIRALFGGAVAAARRNRSPNLERQKLGHPADEIAQHVGKVLCSRPGGMPPGEFRCPRFRGHATNKAASARTVPEAFQRPCP